MKKQITFVIGGCRSGKSSFALDRANQAHLNQIHLNQAHLNQAHLAKADQKTGQPKYFIATSVPTDSEMLDRVTKHQKERGEDWQTIEEPLYIDRAILDVSANASVILIDCLTLWVSNLLFEHESIERIEQAVQDLEKALQQCECPVFLVSNEVGYGIVPENSLARKFRDFAGSVNQSMAAVADTVIMSIAGIDVQIKPKS